MVLAKTVHTEGVFPLPLDALWRLLHAHLDERSIRTIHPWILSGKSIRERDSVEFHDLSFPRDKVAERYVSIGLHPSATKWTYRIEPPIRYEYEIAFPNGSITRFDNTYSSTEGGTLVKTEGRVAIKGVPSFMAVWLVKRSFARSDREDLTYAKDMGRTEGSAP